MSYTRAIEWRYREHPTATRTRRDQAADMKLSLKRCVLLLLTSAVLALLAGGCQTSNGFGKDVEKLGDKIQDKSK
jgi:predicted small secreted protein